MLEAVCNRESQGSAHFPLLLSVEAHYWDPRVNNNIESIHCHRLYMQHVGFFADAVEAARARDKAALALQGNPRLNFHAEDYTKTQVLEVGHLLSFVWSIGHLKFAR